MANRRMVEKSELDAAPGGEDAQANFEEGEVKVIDEENYILSDSYF